MEKRKIFIIGNGFDIAFKRPTRYDDLMEDIYNSVKNSKEIEILKSLPESGSSIWTKDVVCAGLKSEFIKISISNKNKFLCASSSILFKKLIEYHSYNKNWGNIEKIYFDCLNKCKNDVQIKKLNEELDHLKDLIIVYRFCSGNFPPQTKVKKYFLHQTLPIRIGGQYVAHKVHKGAYGL